MLPRPAPTRLALGPSVPPGPLGLPPARRGGALLSWLVVLALGLRALALLAPVGLAFVVSTALLGGVVEEERWRWAIGGIACLALPLVVRWRVAAFLERRTRFAPPAAGWFVPLWNLFVVLVLCLGAADDSGRALRRHGDWFVGERNGLLVRAYRSSVGHLAGYLERFDPPVEVASVVIAPDPHEVPLGPWRPGERPPAPPAVTLDWVHPLTGPRRQMPWTESRRFGAARPQPRPAECELGHCGVDLGGTIGEPVLAAFDGVVERIELDEARGGAAGRYVRLGHKNGTVVTRYIHIDGVVAGLAEGDTVKAGQMIARLGRTGVFHSGPHLHFGLSLRPDGPKGKERYIDPEPLLRTWRMIDPGALGAALATR